MASFSTLKCFRMRNRGIIRAKKVGATFKSIPLEGGGSSDKNDDNDSNSNNSSSNKQSSKLEKVCCIQPIS